MSVHAMVSGTLARDPQAGTSAKGTRWVRASLRVEAQGEPTYFTVMCFGEADCDALAALRKGDPAAAVGRLQIAPFESGGETRIGYTILGARLLTMDAPQPKRERAPRRPSQRREHAQGEPVRDAFADLHGAGDLDGLPG